MSAENTTADGDESRRDNNHAAGATGAALEKRPSAVVATRPGPRPDRSAGVPVRSRRVVYLTARRVIRGAAAVPWRTGRALTGRRAREVVRWLVRNSALYMLVGAWMLTHRWWEARTNARYERQMRSAEAVGDYDKLTEWEDRAERA
jgi:DNA segregation ATPase FtsK/SpoIIIE, S-DNA-T family